MATRNSLLKNLKTKYGLNSSIILNINKTLTTNNQLKLYNTSRAHGMNHIQAMISVAGRPTSNNMRMIKNLLKKRENKININNKIISEVLSAAVHRRNGFSTENFIKRYIYERLFFTNSTHLSALTKVLLSVKNKENFTRMKPRVNRYINMVSQMDNYSI